METLGRRLFQSFITCILHKCLGTLLLTNGLCSLNLCLLVIEILSTLNNNWIISPLIRRYFMLATSITQRQSAYKKFGISGIILMHNEIHFQSAFCPLLIFFYVGFLSRTFTNHRTTGEGEGISLTPHYHFHSFYRHLDISRVITPGSSPLRLASGRIRTGNLWFPNASRYPLIYALQ